MTICIGVTGGICGGKSTVSKILREKGIPVIDADQLGHRAYTPGTSCFHKLVDHFGSSIVDDNGTINRRALGGIVFSDKSKMLELNDIVWPEIRALIIEELAPYRNLDSPSAVPVVAIEAAVMIEAKWYDLFDQVWVVVTDEDTAIQRLIQRNNLTEEQARQRISIQTTNEERCRFANSVITNAKEDTYESLAAKVTTLLGAL